MYRRSKDLPAKTTNRSGVAKRVWSAPRGHPVRGPTGGAVQAGQDPGLGEGQLGASRSGSSELPQGRRKFCDIQDNGGGTGGAAGTAGRAIKDESRSVTTSPICRDVTVDRIIGDIDGLERPELERVAARLAILLDSKTPKIRARRALEQDWHAAAEVVLRPLGIVLPPCHALSKQGYVSSFRKGTVLAEDYVHAMRPRGRADRVRARILISANLLEWMRSCNVPVSFKAWSQNLPNAATAMERSYPGWRASGLLGRVLASRAT